jgi:hypothetical protein
MDSWDRGNQRYDHLSRFSKDRHVLKPRKRWTITISNAGHNLMKQGQERMQIAVLFNVVSSIQLSDDSILFTRLAMS